MGKFFIKLIIFQNIPGVYFPTKRGKKSRIIKSSTSVFLKTLDGE